MKIIKLLLLLLCTLSFKNISAQTIAVMEGGHQPVLVANEKIVLAEWNIILQNSSGINANLQYLSIIKIGESYYLRAKGDDGYVSTILLQQATKSKTDESNSYLEAVGISCTSKACGSNEGCVPTNDKICTPGCDLDNCIKTIPTPQPLNVNIGACIYYFSCDSSHFL